MIKTEFIISSRTVGRLKGRDPDDRRGLLTPTRSHAFTVPGGLSRRVVSIVFVCSRTIEIDRGDRGGPIVIEDV